MADGPTAAQTLLDGLDGYYLGTPTRADLLRRLGREQEAARSYRRALDLTRNPAEQRFLRSRLGLPPQ